MRDNLRYEDAVRIAGLILRYNRGKISDVENLQLMDWKGASDENARLFEELSGAENVLEKVEGLRDEKARQEGWERIVRIIK